MKKLVLLPALGVLVSLGVASAALLDGVEDQTLAAGDSVVSSCGEVTNVSLGRGFNDPDGAGPAGRRWDMGTVNVNFDAAHTCQWMEVTITGTDTAEGEGYPISSGPISVSAGGGFNQWLLPVPWPAVEGIEDIHILAY